MALKKDNSNKPFSSLSYQIFLVTGCWVFLLFTFVEALLLIFKKIYFVYPTGNIMFEIALLIFLFGIESVRNFLGKKGNLTERLLSVVISLLLTIPVVLKIYVQIHVVSCSLSVKVFYNKAEEPE
ncbi:Transmembrane protein 216 like protein [Argiope bruennichi]|uniref:Transmembrane protein 216 like protein n=1 Tax=Argiope bruennichi TaxID=94029 RepID=A0A8T0F8D1_ARGBR|nr:Transmembrane protein 216 like protein [Argiope bruennichi]